MDLNSLFLLTNFLLTIFCGGIILYLIQLKSVESHIFYFLFSFGFIIYGTSLFIRWLSPSYDILSRSVYGFAFFLFSLGLWSFSRKKMLLAIISICFSSAYILLGVYFANFIAYGTVYSIALIVTNFPLIILLIYHATTLRKRADRFILGWFLLLFANFVLQGLGWINDIFAIFSKVVILLGIIDQDFVILTQRIRGEMAFRSIPIETGYREEGGLNIVIPSNNSSYLRKIKWVDRKVRENLERKVKTHLFLFQDTIPYKEIRRIKWINPEEVSVFLFSTSAEKTKKEFAVIPMGITQIGATLSEVTRKYLELDEGCTVVFMDLSVLVHMYGAYPVYNMLLSKMGSIREAGVNLFAFFHPETHSDQSVVSLFTSISNEIIKL